MIIEMDNASKQWIASKGNQVTIKILDVKACCAPGVQELIALPGKPKTLNQYQQLISNQTEFYIHKNVRSNDKLVITLSGLPLLKSLSVRIQ